MADIVLLFILKGRDCMSKVLIEVLVIILIAGSYLILYSAVRVSAMVFIVLLVGIAVAYKLGYLAPLISYVTKK